MQVHDNLDTDNSGRIMGSVVSERSMWIDGLYCICLLVLGTLLCNLFRGHGIGLLEDTAPFGLFCQFLHVAPLSQYQDLDLIHTLQRLQ